MAKKAMKLVRATGEKLLSEHLEDLDVALKPDELLHRGLELAKLEDEEKKLQVELAAAKAVFKQREESLAERRSDLSRVIRDKKEKRSVKVEDWAFYDRGRLESRRTDTGEIVAERALLAAEMQVEFDLGVGEQQAEL